MLLPSTRDRSTTAAYICRHRTYFTHQTTHNLSIYVTHLHQLQALAGELPHLVPELLPDAVGRPGAVSAVHALGGLGEVLVGLLQSAKVVTGLRERESGGGGAVTKWFNGGLERGVPCAYFALLRVWLEAPRTRCASL